MPCAYVPSSLHCCLFPFAHALHINIYAQIHVLLHVTKMSNAQPALGVMQTGSGQSLVTRALVISLLNRIKVRRHNTGPF